MIKQARVSYINSRSECNTYDENGMLPIITAPMYSVVDETNYKIFLDNKVQVCMPRNPKFEPNNEYFSSCSLSEFNGFILKLDKLIEPVKICIDVANGNMMMLHHAIKEAKDKFGDKLIIMSGNVATKEAFFELALAGCDYIRVGVGGSIMACNTTKNTGVGQEDLGKLISECYQLKNNSGYPGIGLSHVKIVADGISTYISQCEKQYGFMDNGYATINKLLWLGADLVMIGKLFVQAFESASEKVPIQNELYDWVNQQIDLIYQKDKNISEEEVRKHMDKLEKPIHLLKVEYQGMSTKESQLKYKDSSSIKHSEGSKVFLPVKWRLNEWLNGSESNSDYLPGFIPCLQSAMSYTNAKELNEFKNG